MGVSMVGNIDQKVKNRLIRFLLKDKLGTRKSLLWIFLQMKSCTTVEIYDFLIKQGFNVNYRAVSSMVGQMHSRLGILRVYLTNVNVHQHLGDRFIQLIMKHGLNFTND